MLGSKTELRRGPYSSAVWKLCIDLALFHPWEFGRILQGSHVSLEFPWGEIVSWKFNYSISLMYTGLSCLSISSWVIFGSLCLLFDKLMCIKLFILLLISLLTSVESAVVSFLIPDIDELHIYPSHSDIYIYYFTDLQK